MEVNSVANVVIQKLTDMLTDEKSIIGKKAIVDQLTEIKNDLEKLRGLFIVAEAKKGSEAIKFAADYLKFLYYVEDAIETFALGISLQQKRLGFLLNHALFLKNFTAYKKLKLKIQKIKKKIEDLEAKNRSELEVASFRAPTPRSDDTDQQSSTDDNNVADFVAKNISNVPVRTSNGILRNISSPTKSDVSLTVRFEPHKSLKKSHSEISSDRKLYSKFSTSYSYKAEELGLVGFDTHINQLIYQLTKGDHQIIPLMGEKGSGKTTLARTIRATIKVKEYFQSSVAWITIDEASTAQDILFNLLKQVGSSKDQDLTHPDFDLDSLINRLNKRLKGNKFLIVLDDLRGSDTWGKIKNAFLDNKNGTKIIVTTRHKAVAESANREYWLDMEGLTDEDTLYLFEQKSESECPENLKRKIVNICDGLPLNVVLLGSLLSTRHSDDWQIELDKGDWQKSGLLASSYNDTSDEEKLCLLYMVLFPKEYDIPVRRLLRLWLAEGFIKRPDPEDRVEECFKSLVQRSLILITNQRSDGGHRKCQLLGALHEYLFPKAIDIKLFHVHRNMPCLTDEASLGARRLVDFVDSKKCDFALKSKLKSCRSYLSFNFQKKDTPAREVGVLLSNMLKSGFSLLRVLDLEGVYKPTLPDNLGNFYQLRYLGLRWTFLDHLPASVGDLTYLETLDLKHTNVNSLPASVWKLNHLRHLNLNDIRLDMPVTSKYSLPGLITLCGLSIVEGQCQVKDGLDRLHLRELDLTFQLEDCGELLDWVSASTSLEQLRLRSKSDQGCASTLSLKPLAGLTKLSHMNFLGKLPNLLAQNQFPPNLKVLTFSVSELKTDPMETLGQLKHLTVLRLLANSYLGTKISCPPNGFKELRVLKLWMLTNLEDWELGENCMEKLNELSIRCCTKLKSVPTKLLQQISFKELILNNMPSKFIMQAEKEKAYHVSLIKKNYTFTPLPTEAVPEWEAAAMLIKAYEEEQQRLEAEIRVNKVRVSELQAKIQVLKSTINLDVNDPATISATISAAQPTSDVVETSKSFM
ncbi:antimicrobial response protein [Lithospermum erythrorhizon]|uniref:Antimicrobial response protein n=1 Tax=Lithospermum erythrorhizon TaxID=34254 RepID=A0AAV3RZZ9_LITER